MFNCELALNLVGIGTLFSCRGTWGLANNTIVKAMSALGQHLLSLLTGFYEDKSIWE
jgi:hypothetical protein